MTFGERLKRLRTEQEVTQKQLGEFAGVPAMTISHWECGHRKPSFNRLCDLCSALGVTSDELLEGIDL